MNKPLFTLTASLWLLLTSAVGLAETYKWVDENGVTHFSDQKHPNAKKVDIAPIATFKSVPVTPLNKPTKNNTGVEGEAAQPYTQLSVLSPKSNEQFHNIGGTLSVSLSLTPALQPGHHIELLFDGKAVPYWGQQQLSGQLVDVFRGAHSVAFNVLDENKRVIKTSASLPFQVHQATVQ